MHSDLYKVHLGWLSSFHFFILVVKQVLQLDVLLLGLKQFLLHLELEVGRSLQLSFYLVQLFKSIVLLEMLFQLDYFLLEDVRVVAVHDLRLVLHLCFSDQEFSHVFISCKLFLKFERICFSLV